jgi:hypothetical protein
MPLGRLNAGYPILTGIRAMVVIRKSDVAPAVYRTPVEIA